MASRIAVMNRGRLVQTGTPAEIYERPNSRFVADFVGTANLFEGEVMAGFNALSLAIPGVAAPVPLPDRMELSTGSRAALALRPEKLVVTRERPTGFALAATIASVGYQGGQSVIHLATDAGPMLRAHFPSDAAQGFARGQAVWASWAPDDAVVLTE